MDPQVTVIYEVLVLSVLSYYDVCVCLCVRVCVRMHVYVYVHVERA